MFKSLIGLFLFVVCFEAHATVEDILSMQNAGDGSFNVICATTGGMTFVTASADDIRQNTVCGSVVTLLLKEGAYEPDQTYCPQKVKWNGEKIEVQTYEGCTVLLDFEKDQDGSYKGKIRDSESSLTYRLTIKSDTTYFFETIDTGSYGTFTYIGQQKQRSKNKNMKASSADPTKFAN